MEDIVRSIPTELTSGRGFDFEDLVGAWLASFMLSSSHIFPNRSALIENIRFQVGNDGWLLDDILVEFSEDLQSFNFALSVKSNKQFTAKKAPDDLIDVLWKQHLMGTDSPFKGEKDYLGIITSPLSGAAKNAVTSLLQKSEHLLEGELEKKVSNNQFSKDVISLYKSFECPTSLQNISNISTDSILKRFKAFQCDFYEQTSNSYTQAIANIKSSLAKPTAKNATNLFEKLCSLIKRYRVNGGTINYQILVTFISNDFSLKLHPEKKADFSKIDLYSCAAISRIKCTIGNKVSLIRAAELDKINQSLVTNQMIVVLGDSGSGKSSLVQRYTSSKRKNGLIWFDAALFEYKDAHEVLKKHLSLEHSWNELAKDIITTPRTIVVDGIDRLWKHEFIAVVDEFIKPLLVKNSSTKIVITCQSFHWQRIQNQLLKVGSAIGNSETVNISDINTDELAILKNQFPQFNKIISNNTVGKFLLRPKILDLFAKMPSNSLPDVNILQSEVDLINWYWNTEITQSEQGALKERFLLKLAKLQGEKLSNTVQVSSFDVPELIALELLEKSQICYRKEGKIYFEHDIYSDWFKQRVIVDELEKSDIFLGSCVDNPQWHRAISLFGTELVQNSTLFNKWEQLIDEAIKKESYLLADLLLESILFAARPKEVLNNHWQYLKGNDAISINRFFSRFLFTATTPNQQTLKLAKQFNVSELEASTINRIPIGLMWVGVLQFVIENQQDLINLAPKNTALICKSWIDNTSKGFPLRKELSDIALKIGWRALQSSQHHRYHERWAGDKHDDLKFFYDLVISCATENLPEVISLAKCASGVTEQTEPLPLDPPPEPITDSERLKLLEDMGSHTTIFDDEKIVVPPINDSANYKVDYEFQEYVLENKGFTTLIVQAPKDAACILLANIIREPGFTSRYSSYDLDKPYGLTKRSMNLFPPFYNKTPFLELLRVSSEQGIRVILRMTEIATDDWFKEKKARSERGEERLFDEGYPLSTVLEIDGSEKEFIGERRWMFGCRATTTPPQILICALMSLEKWLFDKLENDEKVEPIIEDLLKQSNSMSIVGICLLTAKKNNDLFKNVLFGLLKSPWIYAYDLHHSTGDEGYQMMGHGMRETEAQFNAAKEWHTLEHRKQKLEDIVFSLMLNDETFKKRVDDELIPELASWLNNANKNDQNYIFILRLRHQFELTNWNVFKNKEGNIQFNFNPPEELEKIQIRDAEYNSLRSLLLTVPHKCLALIDKNETINEKEIGALFEKLSNIDPDIFVIDDEYASSIRASCALASLIILKKDALPDVYKKHHKTCKEVILHHCFEPPKLGIQIPESCFSIEWDRFCARALPRMLVEEPESENIRIAIANLCMGLHYEALEFLMVSFSNYREQLNDDFYRLLNLVNLWAPLRLRIRIATNDNVWGEEHLTEEQLFEKAEQLVNRYVNKELPITLPNWKALNSAFEEFEQTNSVNKKLIKSNLVKVDDYVILYGYSWLTTLDKASTVKENECWFSIYQQLVLTLWGRLSKDLDSNKRRNGTPYKLDYWILEKVARVLISCSREQAVKLWKPILSLGCTKEYWVTHFLSNWFNQNHINKDNNHFVTIWKDMIVYVKQSPQWFDLLKSRVRNDSIWSALLGIDSIACQFIWKYDHYSIIADMKEHYLFYAEKILGMYNIDKFSYFLSTASGSAIAEDGTNWIFEYLSKVKIHGLRDSEQDTLVQLIQGQLSQDGSFDNLSSKIQESILGLLKILVEKQNIKAMELYKTLI